MRPSKRVSEKCLGNVSVEGGVLKTAIYINPTPEFSPRSPPPIGCSWLGGLMKDPEQPLEAIHVQQIAIHVYK